MQSRQFNKNKLPLLIKINMIFEEFEMDGWPSG